MRVQSLSQSRSVRKFENASVVNDPGADVAALQRNDPDPPTAPEKMVRGPLARSATIVRVIRKPLAPFVAVPFFDPPEPRPHRVDRVLCIRRKISELSGKHRGATGSIDNPTARGDPFAIIDNSVHGLSTAVIEFKPCDLCGTP